VGTHTIYVTATNECSEVYGDMMVLAFCQEIEGIMVDGPTALVIGQPGTYLATPTPITASLPLTYTWDNGTMGTTSVYSWTEIGIYTITVSGTNACGQAGGGAVVEVSEPIYEIFLPIILRGW
jgi:hypothetical protein